MVRTPILKSLAKDRSDGRISPGIRFEFNMAHKNGSFICS